MTNDAVLAKMNIAIKNLNKLDLLCIGWLNISYVGRKMKNVDKYSILGFKFNNK